MSWIDVSRGKHGKRNPDLASVHKQGKDNWCLHIDGKWLTENVGYSIYVNTETRQVKIVEGGPQRPSLRNRLFTFGFTTAARHLGMSNSNTRGRVEAMEGGLLITFADDLQ